MSQGQQFFDEKDADEILRLAANRSGLNGTVSRDQIMATAAELGISPEAVLDAEREVRLQRENDLLRTEYRVYRRSKAVKEISRWAGTSLLLAVINLLTNTEHLWCLWPICIWGVVMLTEQAGIAIKDRTSNEHFDQWKRRRERRRAKAERQALDTNLEPEVDEVVVRA